MTDQDTVWCVMTHFPSDNHLVAIHATPRSAAIVAAKNEGWYVRRWVVQERTDTEPQEVSLGPVRRHPDVCQGELTFSGTRVWVESLIGYLREGNTITEWREDFPTVPLEQAQETLDLVLNLLEEATRPTRSDDS